MKRLLKGLAVAVLVLVVVSGWILASETGLQWTFQLVRPYIPGQLRIEKIEGRLMGPLAISGIDYRQQGRQITLAELQLDWHPLSLLVAKIDISRLKLDKLSLSLPATEADSNPASTGISLPQISLPWRTSIRQLEINQLSLLLPGESIELHSVSLEVSSVFDKIEIESLKLAAENFTIDLKGELEASANYPHRFDLAWQLRLPSGAMIDSKGSIAGNLDATRVEQQLSGDLQLSLSGQVENILRRLTWQADIEASSSSLAKLVADSPDIGAKLQLQANGDLASAHASGSLDSAYPDIGAIQAQFELDYAGDQRLHIERLDLISADSHLSLQGYWQPGEAAGKVDVALDWQNLRWPLQGEALVESSKGSATLKGSLDAYRVTLLSDNPLPQAPPSSWSASASGNQESIDIDALRIKADAGELRASGKIGLTPEITWQARVEADTSNLAELVAGSPALSGLLKMRLNGDLQSATAKGDFSGELADVGPFTADFSLQSLADRSINVERLSLRSKVDNGRVDLQGHWQPGERGGEVRMALNWMDLRWPLQGEAIVDNAHGSGRVDGSLDDYSITIEGEARHAQAGAIQLQADAVGNLKGMDIKQLALGALEGDSNIVALVDWSEGISWQAWVSASEVNPKNLLPAWPGQISAQLETSGSWRDQHLRFDSEITSLSGNLRGYPVSLSSRMAWADQVLQVKQLDFSSGSSQLSAQGSLGEQLQLDWQLLTRDLAELYPGAQGEIVASGQLKGKREKPQIEAVLSGKQLALEDYAVDSVEATISIDLDDWQRSEIRLLAGSLKMPDYALESLEINGDTRQLQVSLMSKDFSAELAVSGSLQQRSWRGQIDRADIQSKRYQDWQLAAPALLAVDESSLQVDSLCWQNELQASLCARLQRQQDDWRSQLELQRVPLLLLSNWLPSDLKLEGLVNGSASLHYRQGGRLSGRADMILPAGLVSYPLLQGDRDLWEYESGSLLVTLQQEGIKASANININATDRILLNLELPGADLLTLDAQTQSLQGDARINVSDLGMIEAIVPEVQQFKGAVVLNLVAAGTLALPKLSGEARIDNASLQVPRLGLTVEQINFHAVTDGFESLQLSLQAKSGGGTLAIEGKTLLDRTAGWPTQISIKGDRFEASRIPEARVLVSPDLKVVIEHHNILTTGSVTIPYAKLQPTDISTAAQVSNDVVISGGELAAEEKWAMTTRVRLILGEQVTVFGFGFEGRLDGSLLLEDEPGQLTRAIGEINIPQGRYRAYGQRLDVEQGRLLYTGGPLTNPGLNLRAVRHVDTITAGIRVKGSLDQPQLELFSNPAMGQTDTLSYLVLGRPMETASGEEGAVVAKAALALGLSGGDRLARLLGDRFGLDEMRVESGADDQASLVVGRYLSPRLYVSYGVGLIEAINTFTLRYKITEKWQLKAESGEAQGADLLYTIER